MIKGVNKRVVEIVSNEHEYFEKAVLYVRAEKSSTAGEILNEEARIYLGSLVPVKKKLEISPTAKLIAAAAVLFTLLTAICLAVCLL